MIGVQLAVGKNQNVVAATHVGRPRQRSPASRHAVGTALDRIADAQVWVRKARSTIFDAADPLQIGIAENRALTSSRFVVPPLVRSSRLGRGPTKGDQRHHQFLADRIDRRVGYLRELLFEIVGQQLGSVGQHGGECRGPWSRSDPRR